jgi:DNA invertase Pin-like site-specific DNA recombinase
MKLAAYLRVSTESQVDGLGLDIQRDAVRRWCKDHGHRIAATFTDAGVSGTKDAADRPGLTGALAAIAEGRAAGLVAYRLDRLARSLTVQEAVLSQVWKIGGEAFTVDVGQVLRDDPDDPMRIFVRQVMGAAAQLERNLVASRMRAGRRLKAERGGYAGFGSPPLGFRAEHREMAPDVDEQITLARITELRARGRSLREIAATLTEEGHRTKRGGRWHPQTLRLVLARGPRV